MTKGVQFRRGTTGQHDLFSGAEGEITVDTEKKIAVVQDGAKSGGYPLVGTGVTQTLSNKEFSGVTTFKNDDNTSTVSIGIGNTSGTALKITHTGSGNAFVVEDSSADATPFVIDATGNVGIGTTIPNYELSLVGTGVTSTTPGLAGVIAEFVGYVTAYTQINLRNTEGISTTASADFIVTADIGSDTANYIDLGINNGSFSPNLSNEGWSINGALDGYLYSQTGGLSIGVAATTGGKRLSLFVGGLKAQNERVAITTVGVGIGTTNPVAQFQVGSILPASVVGVSSFAVVDSLGRIGIGTNVIQAQLNIVSPPITGGIEAVRVGIGSTTTATFVIDSNPALATPGTVGVGSVGLGTDNPKTLLDIYGSVNVTDGPGGIGIITSNIVRLRQYPDVGGYRSAVGAGSSGTINYTTDGLLILSSGISTHGKNLIPTESFHRLAVDRSAFVSGATQNAFFGAAVPLTPSGLYEIDYDIYFNRSTTGVTTFRITNTAANAAIVSLNAVSTAGVTTAGFPGGTAQMVAHIPTTMSATNPGLGFSFSNGTSNFARIRVVAANTNSATNMRLDVQNSNGTVTPLQNSMWKCRYLGDTSTLGIGLTA